MLIVPTPSVNVAVLMGQPRILQCNITTVRGVTSSMDIVWKTDKTVLDEMNNVNLTAVGKSLFYSDVYHYTNTTDQSTIIFCEAVINAISNQVTANDSTTIEPGKC